jgi:hypothetical protein
MAEIQLGGDQPTEATVDQSQYIKDSKLYEKVEAAETNLTITNTTGTNAVLNLYQDVHTYPIPEETPVITTVTLGEDTHVHLQEVSSGDYRPEQELNYVLNEGATLEVSLELDYDRPSSGYNVDMDADSASTLIYHHEVRPWDTQSLNLTGLSAGDQIKAGYTRVTYFNNELTFYGYDSDGQWEEMWVKMHVEGLDPDQIYYENGTLTYACYLKGTRIATLDGETEVEDLNAGDQVRTATGDINTVKWLGFRKLNRSQLPAEHALRASPIRIFKGAFADNVPHRDLTVSPGHRFNFDGALVPALSLVNGVTIVQDFDIQEFEYYHVELEKFDMLLAEGAAAESYLEVGSNRNSFQNARTVTAHPDFGPAPKNVMLAQYVQKITPEIIEPIRRELFKRAEILTGARRTGDIGLRIEINGQIIHSQTPCRKKGLYRFELPAGLRGDIHILSNAAVVRETSLIDRTDTRVIGVGLAGIALITNDQRYEIDLSDSALFGLNEVQEMDGTPMRWTLGEAIIPARLLPKSITSVVFELNVLRTHMYWTSAEQQKTRKAA